MSLVHFQVGAKPVPAKPSEVGSSLRKEAGTAKASPAPASKPSAVGAAPSAGAKQAGGTNPAELGSRKEGTGKLLTPARKSFAWGAAPSTGAKQAGVAKPVEGVNG